MNRKNLFPQTSGMFTSFLPWKRRDLRYEYELLARREESRIKHEREREERLEYLHRVEALPVTPEMYAAWLYTYLERGGKITRRCNTKFRVITDPPAGSGRDPYEDSTLHWMPTKSTSRRMPVGYGANALALLVVPHIAEVDLTPSSGDGRGGWEYGHTSVRVLTKIGTRLLRGFTATTNQPDVVANFTDVNETLATFDSLGALASSRILDIVSLR